MPTPIPSPFPVTVVNPPPEWFSGEWWIQAGVPLLGAIGSIAVAVVAVRVTVRLARLDRLDRARTARAGFAVAVDAYLHPRADPGGARRSLAENFERRENGLLTAAAAADDEALKIAHWIINQESLLAERNAVGSIQGLWDEQQAAWERYSLDWEVATRVRAWVASGRMNYGEIDYTSSDADGE